MGQPWARDVLAGMYGYLNWSDLVENLSTDRCSVSVWDDELSEDVLDERREIQLEAISRRRRMSESKARSIIRELKPSNRVRNPRYVDTRKPDSIDEFSSAARWTSGMCLSTVRRWLVRVRQSGARKIAGRPLHKAQSGSGRCKHSL